MINLKWKMLPMQFWVPIEKLWKSILSTVHPTNLNFHLFFSLQTEYISKVVPKMVIVHHLISQALFWARLIFQINDEFQSFQTDRLLWQIFRYPNKKVHSICRATCNHKMHSFQRVGSFNEDGGWDDDDTTGPERLQVRWGTSKGGSSHC